MPDDHGGRALALEAVGFLARVIPALAGLDGVNPVAGFCEHLFVPADPAQDALRCLQSISGKAAATLSA